MVYPLTIYELIDGFANMTGNPVVAQKLTGQRTNIIIWLAAYQLVFISVVFAVSIFQSHKIAGPMFKLSKFLKHIKDGNRPEILFFRKGDHFKEIADEFNEALQTLQDQYSKDFAYLNEVNSYINNLALIVPEDKKPVLKEINTKLKEIQERYQVKD